LVELTVAGAVLLLALLATLPLLARSLSDVARGGARAEASGAAQDALEFRHWSSGDGAISRHYFSVTERRWSAEPPAAPDRTRWVREIRVVKLGLEALQDGLLEEVEYGSTGLLRLVEVQVTRGVDGVAVVTLSRIERSAP
jgi:hypothetical protein